MMVVMIATIMMMVFTSPTVVATEIMVRGRAVVIGTVV
jgi:hypothetical protein